MSASHGLKTYCGAGAAKAGASMASPAMNCLILKVVEVLVVISLTYWPGSFSVKRTQVMFGKDVLKTDPRGQRKNE